MKQIWFDIEQEHRRLYAIEKGAKGKWIFYLDRRQVIELTPWPLKIPRLDVGEVETFARMAGAKGVYMILTKAGGSWGGYILRRGYTPAECRRIQTDPDEALHDKPHTTKSEKDRYVFHRKNDVWEVVFNGCEPLHIPHRAGMTYIHALLAKRGVSIPVCDLYEIENPPSPEEITRRENASRNHEGAEIAANHGTGGKRQKVHGTSKEIEAGKRILKNQIAELEDDPDHDPAELADKKNKLAIIEQDLLSTYAKRTFEPAEQKKPRQAVSNAIKQAIAKTGSKALSEHLKAIQTGNEPIYTGGFNWKT